ncbi:polysaccharide pyruvyl transferase family protein [Brumimicrobium oceani]|uniref:Polysaccharide pyruvyl transferase family protein n=1 Tax=Brumimicrobium oceani TaxID=2100725 RepID=A0A2U2XGP7_9FLAO|nr:polysaccharide pyruvyl transferase family protein [Brumimicrobium oceani]PWH86972.1 polysaccharide pyruvyl transferase family protein [Brumimicrobium oceani]
MFKTDILFTGFYGNSNTGDDAFVEVASWGADKLWNKKNNRFLAVDDNLPTTLTPSKGYPLTIPKTYRLQDSILVRNCDYLISGGGSTIHNKLDRSNVKHKAIQRKLSKKNLKIGGIGVSIGPFKTIEDEKHVEDYLKNIDFLAVRDKASFDYVSSLSLPYKPVNAFDLAALLPNIYNFSPEFKLKNKVKTIGVSVCPHESIQGDLNIKNEIKRNNKTNELLKSIDETQPVHFKFYIINGHHKIGDYQLTLETIKKVNPKSYEIIEYSKDTQNIWKSISNCDFMISTRLHAAVFACFSNTPFMLNEYHRKCTDFLFNIGYNEDYRLYDSEYDTKDKTNKILEIINDQAAYVVPSRISEMKEQALLNFTEINL